VKAITLWRPWDFAITDLGKRCENRPQPPPAAALGQRVAIHAGLAWKLEGFFWPPDVPKPNAKDPDTCRQMALRAGRIVATARVVGWLDARGAQPVIHSMGRAGMPMSGALWQTLQELQQDRWWLGPVGILLDDVFKLPDPVPCRGMQGWWHLPEESVIGTLRVRVKERVLEQEAVRDQCVSEHSPAQLELLGRR
jgi:hypothetical protein